jgi:hypothetical protein
MTHVDWNDKLQVAYRTLTDVETTNKVGLSPAQLLEVLTFSHKIQHAVLDQLQLMQEIIAAIDMYKAYRECACLFLGISMMGE